MSVSWINAPAGWLLYSGPMGSGDCFITSKVYRCELSAASSMYGPRRITFQAELTGPELVQGTDAGTGLWTQLQTLPSAQFPPEMKALLELARRHPEEYEELREGEAVIRALGGLPRSQGSHYHGRDRAGCRTTE